MLVLLAAQLLAFGVPVIEGPTSAEVTAVVTLAQPNPDVATLPIHAIWDAVPNAAGYVLYLGQSSGVYTQRLVVGTPTSFVTYTPVGTWFVAVAAYREAFGPVTSLRAPNTPVVKEH